MNTLFVLMSHDLTKEQYIEAEERFNINNFIKLAPELQELWSNVNPEGELSEDYLNSIKKFILDNMDKYSKNYALIQGEYGVVYNMVNWCFSNTVKPMYATTKRVYSQQVEDDGSIKRIHTFKHVNFRFYK